MRNYLRFLLFVLIGSYQVVSAQNLNDSLLLHYRFNGDAVDYSGNGWDGIPGGGVTYVADRAGNPGYAIQFNGANSYLDLPGVAQLKPQLPISFSFWVKPDNIFTPSVFFTTDFQQNNYHGAWVNYDPNGGGTIGASFGNGAGNTGAPSRHTKFGNISIANATWSHIAVVIRGPNDIDIYVNCVKDGGSYSGDATGMVYSSTPGSIGRHDTQTTGPAWYYPGAMDDFRYWNRALTDQEAILLCEEVPVSAVPQQDLEYLELFPNPVTDGVVNLSLPPSIAKYETRIYDIHGKMVLENFNSPTLDVSGFAKGIYLVRVLAKEKSYQRKLIVK